MPLLNLLCKRHFSYSFEKFSYGLRDLFSSRTVRIA